MSGWVRSATTGLEKFLLEIPNFSIFTLRVKKISSPWVKKIPRSKTGGLLFTAGQNYAQFWSKGATELFGI